MRDDGASAMPDELNVALSDYAEGLESELSVLDRLDVLSRAQHQAALSADVAQLARASSERHDAERAIGEIEGRIARLRPLIARNLGAARSCRGFAALAAAHRRAEALIAGIVERDRQTVVLLLDADRVRRQAAQAIETGEATLAAYRKVIAPPPSSAGLVSRRG